MEANLVQYVCVPFGKCSLIALATNVDIFGKNLIEDLCKRLKPAAALIMSPYPLLNTLTFVENQFATSRPPNDITNIACDGFRNGLSEGAQTYALLDKRAVYSSTIIWLQAGLHNETIFMHDAT